MLAQSSRSFSERMPSRPGRTRLTWADASKHPRSRWAANGSSTPTTTMRCSEEIRLPGVRLVRAGRMSAASILGRGLPSTSAAAADAGGCIGRVSGDAAAARAVSRRRARAASPPPRSSDEVSPTSASAAPPRLSPTRARASSGDASSANAESRPAGTSSSTTEPSSAASLAAVSTVAASASRARSRRAASAASPLEPASADVGARPLRGEGSASAIRRTRFFRAASIRDLKEDRVGFPASSGSVVALFQTLASPAPAVEADWPASSKYPHEPLASASLRTGSSSERRAMGKGKPISSTANQSTRS